MSKSTLATSGDLNEMVRDNEDMDDGGSRSLRYGMDPVIISTGNFEHKETDLQIKSRGMNLSFVRTYRSGTTTNEALGPKWQHNHSKKIVVEYEPFSPIQSFPAEGIARDRWVSITSTERLEWKTSIQFLLERLKMAMST